MKNNFEISLKNDEKFSTKYLGVNQLAKLE